jgi:hypothetical protein
MAINPARLISPPEPAVEMGRVETLEQERTQVQVLLHLQAQAPHQQSFLVAEAKFKSEAPAYAQVLMAGTAKIVSAARITNFGIQRLKLVTTLVLQERSQNLMELAQAVLRVSLGMELSA